MAEEVCCYCGEPLKKYIGHINRANKLGAKIYCNRTCAGLGRRSKETIEEKKHAKAWYDAFIRESMTDKERAIDKKKRHEYFKKDYAANPDKYRAVRKRKQDAHNEYCRRPEYRKYKKVYDQQYRAKKHYGKYWEAFIALCNLSGVVDNRQAKADQKIFNKQQKRKRNAKANAKRQELEKCTMGLYQPS